MMPILVGFMVGVMAGLFLAVILTSDGTSFPW